VREDPRLPTRRWARCFTRARHLKKQRPKTATQMKRVHSFVTLRGSDGGPGGAALLGRVSMSPCAACALPSARKRLSSSAPNFSTPHRPASSQVRVSKILGCPPLTLRIHLVKALYDKYTGGALRRRRIPTHPRRVLHTRHRHFGRRTTRYSLGQDLLNAQPSGTILATTSRPIVFSALLFRRAPTRRKRASALHTASSLPRIGCLNIIAPSP